MSDKLIRASAVAAITGLSKSEILRQVRVHRFPQPIRIGRRCTRWSEAEVAEWVEGVKNERASARSASPVEALE